MRKVLIVASVASMIDQFNMDNIRILKDIGCEVHFAANFDFGNTSSQNRVSKFRQKSILNDVGLFNENQSFSEDALFFIKACHIKKCVFLNIGHCFFGGGKSFFGQSGLSKNIWKMEKGELSNIFYAYSNDIINLFEFSIISSFSLLKFIRRFFLTGINRLK